MEDFSLYSSASLNGYVVPGMSVLQVRQKAQSVLFHCVRVSSQTLLVLWPQLMELLAKPDLTHEQLKVRNVTRPTSGRPSGGVDITSGPTGKASGDSIRVTSFG